MDNISQKLNLKISKKALELQRLNLAVKASLPRDCKEHMEIAAIRNNQLVVITDSPVWQTRLRMYSQSMLEALHQYAGIKLTRVYIKSTPKQRVIEPPLPVYRTLSNENAELIKQTARCISDSRLQTALLSLSNKTQDKVFTTK